MVPGLAYTLVACATPPLFKPCGVVIVDGHDTPLGVAVPGWPAPAGLRRPSLRS